MGTDEGEERRKRKGKEDREEDETNDVFTRAEGTHYSQDERAQRRRRRSKEEKRINQASARSTCICFLFLLVFIQSSDNLPYTLLFTISLFLPSLRSSP